MRCNICELRCNIGENRSGRCNMYKCENGRIVEKFPNSYLFVFPISIETQPMLHFYPGHKFLQVSSIGCNFRCTGCISEVLARNTENLSGIPKKYEPEQIIKKAKDENCIGITFAINEPTVSYYTFKNLAQQAKENGLLVGFSSNLYFTEEAILNLIPYIDFVNVGVKGFSDKIYQDVCKVPSSKPVFRNMEILKRHNVHFEVSIPYLKGSEKEVTDTAKFLSSLSKDIPLQIMRFIPMGEADIHLEPTIRESEDLVKKLNKYLNFVYLFNSPGTQCLDTNTKDIDIKREFWGPMGAHIVDVNIKTKVPKFIIGNISRKNFKEKGFFGGYRITRAVEMVIGILNALGVKDTEDIKALLPKILNDKNNFILNLHEVLDSSESNLYDYLKVTDYLSKISGKERRGKELTDYIMGILTKIEQIAARINENEKIKAYYVMGYPLFALSGERFECKMVEFVGCRSVNKLVKREGRPGVNITPEELNMFNPDIAFISGFLSSSEQDFKDYCLRNDIRINALKTGKIYRLPIGWDFGTMNWVLGLMFIANKAYPQYYNFDIEREANDFYKVVYNMKFANMRNRSFYVR